MLRLSELIRAYEAHTGEIEVVGWVRTARQSKNVGFIELGDGSCFKNVQIVYETENIDPNIVKSLNTGAAIGVKGELVLTPDMPQPFEIKAQSIEILGKCDSDYHCRKRGTALISSHHTAFKAKDQHVPGCVQGAQRCCAGHTQVL